MTDYGYWTQADKIVYPKNAMKFSNLTLLAMISLSVALCACDSGDKKEAGAAAAVPNKKPKADKAATDTGAAANPQPPEAGEAAKNMNEAPAAPQAFDSNTPGEKFSQLDMINGAVKAFKSRQGGQSMMMSNGMSVEQQKKMFMEKAKAGKSGNESTLTSLDQLVKAGLLKSVPEAPEGKKYVIDAKTQEVRLEKK